MSPSVKMTANDRVRPLYAGLSISGGQFCLAVIGDDFCECQSFRGRGQLAADIFQRLAEYVRGRKAKIIAAAFAEKKTNPALTGHLQPLMARLWLELDIVPSLFSIKAGTTEEIALKAAQRARRDFDRHNLVKVKYGARNEVKTARLVTLTDYQKITLADDFKQLLELARKFKGRRLVFINSTPRGGGVALMRHALLRLYRLLEVDAHWFVLKSNKRVFGITKRKFHNILQGVAAPGVHLTEKDQRFYEGWSKSNAHRLEPVFEKLDVAVIDDPQPAGLIPFIKKINPRAKIIFRSHIQIDSDLIREPDSAQNQTWSFIWERVRTADLFVSHPIKKFIPAEVPNVKRVLMPAATDPLDGINKPLTDRQTTYYLSWFNRILAKNGQPPLDWRKPYLIQIARFDPSKGIPDLIEAYRRLCQVLRREGRPRPQLVVAGRTSVDDPDFEPIYALVTGLLRQNGYAELAGDVKVARLPHSDQMVNALIRKSRVALQLSHKEGFEVAVTEALAKGKPVVAYRAGGIPLQIRSGRTGYLVRTGSTRGVAKHLHDLLTDRSLYRQMSRAASQTLNPDFFTVKNAIGWLYLAGRLCQKDGRPLKGNGRRINDLIHED